MSSTALDFDRDFAEVAARVFIRAQDSWGSTGSRDEASRQLWSQLGELGMVLLTTDERHGGSGGSWFEAYVLHRAAAYHGIALPLVEHDLLGAWLLSQMDQSTDERIIAVGAPAAGLDKLLDVPWARSADRIVAIEPGANGQGIVVEHTGAGVEVLPGANLASEPRDRVRVVGPGSRLGTVNTHQMSTLRHRGALARSIQLVGALERCVDIAADHARVRRQFGKPIIGFQAVQALLADAASETAVARAATIGAVRAAEAAGEDLVGAELAIAIAKSCSSHAAGLVTRKTHQVLGAIGTTREHELHRFTLPALAWRQEFGSAQEWDAELSTGIEALGVESMWQSLLDTDPEL